jgi:Xaa-Pro aminopeptidase
MYPFNAEKLSSLLEQAELDLLLATTRHNVRYLTGGYYYHFHARFTRMGTSQYLPIVGVPRGRLDNAFYIGTAGESGQIDAQGLWIDTRAEVGRGTVPAAERAAAEIARRGLEHGRIGLELPFFPADAYAMLQRALPHAALVDATAVLDELRAIKTPHELDILRSVYDRTAQAICATFAAGTPGVTTLALAEQVRREMGQRSLDFLWVFACAGPSYLRAPSQQTWQPGRVLHLDAGGEDGDYLADLCRMGCLDQPSALANDLHTACLAVQERVRRSIRPGLPCVEVLHAGERAIAEGPHAERGRFVAHGIGMVSHEQPVITPQNRRPLEPGMVLSLETEYKHPEVGHVKIEDAVAVTAAGCEGLGDQGREWQIAGLPVSPRPSVVSQPT